MREVLYCAECGARLNLYVGGVCSRCNFDLKHVAATTVPWDTIRRLRTHLEFEQRHAFVDALDKLGEKACEADEYAAVFAAMENGFETPKPKVVARGTVKLERVDDA